MLKNETAAEQNPPSVACSSGDQLVFAYFFFVGDFALG